MNWGIDYLRYLLQRETDHACIYGVNRAGGSVRRSLAESSRAVPASCSAAASCERGGLRGIATAQFFQVRLR